MGNPYAPPPASGPPRRDESAPQDLTRERHRPWPGGVPPETPPPGERGRRRPLPSPEAVRTASRRALVATGLTFGALVTSAMPLPWPAVALVLALAAIASGIRALRTVWVLGLRGALLPVVTVSLVLAVLYLVSSVGVLLTWRIQQEHQECLARALTVSAHDRCDSERREALESFSPGAP